jgi:hypothetical protein
MTRLDTLVKNLGAALATRIDSTAVDRGEVTIVVPAISPASTT